MHIPRDEERAARGISKEELGILCMCAARYAMVHDNMMSKKVPAIIRGKAEQLLPKYLEVLKNDYRNINPKGTGWSELMETIK